MKLFHASDLHYAPKTLEEVDRAFSLAVDHAIKEQCDAAVLSGDLFDHRVDLPAPGVAALLARVHTLANAMPVLILQGTYRHDAPGSLDVFKTIGGKHEVFVADRICQVMLDKFLCDGEGGTWITSQNWKTESDFNPKPLALFSCLPSVNKAAVAAAVGGENAAEAVGEHVFDLMRGWSAINLKARADGIPTVLVSHGTVSGSITEQGVPMAGLDHEFTTGSLFAAETSAVMLGHIHQHQWWAQQYGKGQRLIVYPGSIGRLHFGETKPKGFLIWEVGSTDAAFRFHETPAKRLLQIDFPGVPDMAELERQAVNAEGAHVRTRYSVDIEYRASIDKEAIPALFKDAADLHIEGHVNSITRTRADGMNRAVSLSDTLIKWAQVTQTDSGPLLPRLASLGYQEPERIVRCIFDEENKQEG